MSRVSASGAIAFVDVVGFTAFTERYGDGSAVTVVDRVEQVTRDALPRDAQLVKLLGDGALVWFARAATAVPTMLEVVTELANGSPAIPTRASVHYGHVVFRDADGLGRDVIGRDVNVAVRLVDVARPGEVLCSATARAGTNPTGIRFTTRGVAALAGIDRRMHVFAATRVPASVH